MIQHIATGEMKVSDLLSSDDSVLSNLWPHAGPGTCKIGPILTMSDGKLRVLVCSVKGQI